MNSIDGLRAAVLGTSISAHRWADKTNAPAGLVVLRHYSQSLGKRVLSLNERDSPLRLMELSRVGIARRSRSRRRRSMSLRAASAEQTCWP